jgi:hypothetical protein
MSQELHGYANPLGGYEDVRKVPHIMLSIRRGVMYNTEHEYSGCEAFHLHMELIPHRPPDSYSLLCSDVPQAISAARIVTQSASGFLQILTFTLILYLSVSSEIIIIGKIAISEPQPSLKDSAKLQPVFTSSDFVTIIFYSA